MATKLSSSPNPRDENTENENDNDDDDDNAKKNDQLSAMRNALESSWDGDLMGILPSTPAAGAEASAEAVAAVVKDGVSVVMVNILLPSYDITQGPNSYDEVLMAEFGTALAENLKKVGVASKKSAVLLKNAESERNVKRTLEMKRRRNSENGQEGEEEKKEEESDVDDNESFRRQLQSSWEGKDETEEEDDVDDVDSYRRQLQSSWGGDDDDNTSEKKTPNPTPATTTSSYRIGSLLGEAYISPGPDMFDDVISAVDEYAVRDTDDAIIILSAHGPDSMIAVRRVVAAYGSDRSEKKRPIVLVNCKFETMPVELRTAVMGYSILPLLARQKINEGGFSSQQRQGRGEDDGVTKIVLLRRYPKDWELFVDVSGRGNGFELAGSLEADGIVGSSKTPPMEWVSGCVKRHMDFKYRQ
eukprot:CAMPEP_0172497976 /NCGR_PEP_ID=MMETSP1066-20121228/107693_1 /TAXON_ID=671091 /ORGANISM="Coscinodiscus wailesii, Strain CCMP2513" /LENGTH=414 /DNA_ID=CAMNT_0013271037 /DNA_START=294 /DNA_END=1538 /DNA_ORIENTATION=-